jgi:HK97 family phage major capsid protein
MFGLPHLLSMCSTNLAILSGDGETGDKGAPVSDYAPGSSAAWLITLSTATTLAKLKSTIGDYLMPPPAFTALQHLVTNQIPTNLGTGANESQAFMGQWDRLALGMRSGLQIEVSREAGYFDGTTVQSAFSHDQTVIRAILRADWQMLHSAAFCEVTGMTS